jgi:hypothetical protein
VLGHTKYNEVYHNYFDQFPTKLLYYSHLMDLIIIGLQGIQLSGFVVSPDFVWYARVLQLFSVSVSTDTWSKSFDCALV